MHTNRFNTITDPIEDMRSALLGSDSAEIYTHCAILMEYIRSQEASNNNEKDMRRVYQELLCVATLAFDMNKNGIAEILADCVRQNQYLCANPVRKKISFMFMDFCHRNRLHELLFAHIDENFEAVSAIDDWVKCLKYMNRPHCFLDRSMAIKNKLIEKANQNHESEEDDLLICNIMILDLHLSGSLFENLSLDDTNLLLGFPGDQRILARMIAGNYSTAYLGGHADRKTICADINRNLHGDQFVEPLMSRLPRDMYRHITMLKRESLSMDLDL